MVIANMDMFLLLSTTSIAVELASEKACKIMDYGFFDMFKMAYTEECKKNPDKNIVPLDYLIDYVCDYLKDDVNPQLLSGLRAKRDSIVKSIFTRELRDLLTMNVSKKQVYKMLCSYSNRPIKFSIDSQQVSNVFNEFLEVFRKHHATAFAFRGTFAAYCSHCFDLFYKSRKRDIWNLVYEQDITKKQSEGVISNIAFNTIESSEDFVIRSDVANIKALNNLLFKHSGHNSSVHGVLYDSYYLIILYLCEKLISTFDCQFDIELVDPYGFSEELGNANLRGIRSKIEGAKKILHYTYDILSKGISMSDLVLFRTEIFSITHDFDNNVWYSERVHNKTFDELSNASYKNYKSLDRIMQGVRSIIKLQYSLVERGLSIVDTYNRDMFLDDVIVRSIDRISSIEVINLIKRLHNEATSLHQTGHEHLLVFNQMLEEYLGVDSNNQRHIRLAKEDARVFGILDKPRIKQSTDDLHLYDKCVKLTHWLTSFPRSVFDNAGMNLSTLSSMSNELLISTELGKHMGSKASVVLSRNIPAVSLYFSDFEDNAKYHEWHLLHNCIVVEHERRLYIHSPQMNKFISYAEVDDNGNISISDALVVDQDVMMDYIRTNGYYTINIPCLSDDAQSLYNIALPLDIMASSYKIPKYKKRQLPRDYESMVKSMYAELNDLSSIATSLRDIWYVLMTNELITQSTSNDSQSILLTNASIKLFIERNLSKALENILHNCDSMSIVRLESINYVSQRKLNTTIVNTLLSGDGNQCLSEFTDICNLLFEDYVLSCGERFILLHNWLSIKLAFIRNLVDTFKLIFGIYPDFLMELTLELEDRFSILRQFDSFKDLDVDTLLAVNTIDTVMSTAFCNEVMTTCKKRYSVALNDLNKIISTARGEMCSISSYTSIERLREASNTCKSLGPIVLNPDFVERNYVYLLLNSLSSKATFDEFGFVMMWGELLEFNDDGAIYYLHNTGRFVHKHGRVVKAPVTVEECTKYLQVVTDGISKTAKC